MANALTDQITKEAWEKNWENIPMEKILEIFNYVRVKKQMDIFLKVLPKNGKILEGGCGLAPYLIRLRQMGYDVTGIDYNEGPIQKILAYDATLPVRVGDVTAIPYPDASFGAYLSLGVIEHFTDGPQKAIQEASRVLRPGGVFLVAVPTWNIFMTLAWPLKALKASAWIRRFFGKPVEHHYWEQYFKKKKLVKYLEQGGFKVREIHPLDHSHTLVSFSRLFRDRTQYDEANAWALRLAGLFEKYLPWQTASQMTLVCEKIGKP